MRINMKLQELRNNNESFNKNLDEHLIPTLIERFNKGEEKIEYKENELREILGINNYETFYLYTKLRDKILDFDMGVSIKRIPRDNRFTFFVRTSLMKSVRDDFRVKFKQKFMPGIVDYLKTNDKIGIPESWIKEHLKCENYTIDYLYSRFRKFLENTSVGIILTRKMPVKNETLNIYTFYNKKIENPLKEDEDEREFRNYLMKSENQNQGNQGLENQIKLNKELSKEEYEFVENIDTPNITCPNCNEGKVKYPEIICTVCKIQVLKQWK